MKAVSWDRHDHFILRPQGARGTSFFPKPRIPTCLARSAIRGTRTPPFMNVKDSARETEIPANDQPRPRILAVGDAMARPVVLSRSPPDCDDPPRPDARIRGGPGIRARRVAV